MLRSNAPSTKLPADTPVLIDILTLFPAICEGAVGTSMMKRAQEAGAARIRVHNIRDWAHDKHRVTDDTPYGGGQGMVMKPEPIFEAVDALRQPEMAAKDHPDVAARTGVSPAGGRRNWRATNI